jgi:hypothetical protein
MNIQILESAVEDLKGGYYFYEFQERGLSDYFLESLYADIESLKLYAGIHLIQFEKYFRLLSMRFPFAIYYTKDENNVLGYAVLDCRRDPAWIRNKLK